MTCRDISKALALGAGLPSGAPEHLRYCESCRRLVAVSEWIAAEAELSAEAERKVIGAVTCDLKPVSPLGSPWRYTAMILIAAALVAALGIAVLGTTGWSTNPTLRKVYFTIFLAAGITTSAAMLSRLMIPGALFRIPPAALVVAAMVALLAGGLLYPVARYEHFARAVMACFTIGTLHAVVAGTLCVLVLRRGFVVSRETAALVAGLTGGLTGLVVLFVFCPHLDAGHYLLAHATAVIFATAAGPAVLYASEHWRR
jgi:hypothetical protein